MIDVIYDLQTNGDVDLYVSTINERPGISNRTWYSAGYGRDTVLIPAGDPLAQGKNKFYIVARGARNLPNQVANVFTIMAYQSNTSVPLREGTSTRGVVRTRGYSFFSIKLIRDGSMTINLEVSRPGVEDADIFVSTTTTKPTAMDYEYRAIKFGNDVVTIPNASSYRTYYIAVYGSSAGTGSSIAFTISAQQNYQILQTNSYGGGVLAHVDKDQTTQFRIRVNGYAKHVLVSCALITGRTKLFLSTNGTRDATETDNEYAKNTGSSSAILLTKDVGKSFSSGTWSVGVQGVDDASSYFISVMAYPYYSYLSTAVPLVGLAPADDFMVFTYFLPVATNASMRGYYLSLTVMSGIVNLYLNTGYKLPTPQNHTLKSEGPNNRIIMLDPQIIPFGRSMTIAVYGGSKTEDNFYSLVMSAPNGARYLTENQPQEEITYREQYNYYQVLKPGAARGDYKLYVQVESCNLGNAPALYVSENSVRPKNDSYEATSTGNGYYQTLTLTPSIPHPDARDNRTSFYIAVYGDAGGHTYTIRTSTKSDAAPYDIKDAFIAGRWDGSSMLFDVAPAVHQQTGTQVTLQYQLFRFEMQDADRQEKGTNPATVANFFTSCGVKKYGTLVGTQTASTNDAQNRVSFKLDDMHNDRSYLLAVVVTDGHGVEAAYKPGWVVDGIYTTEYSVPYRYGGPSIGGLLILFLFVALLLYFIVGMIVNLIRKKRGLDVIPHRTFWLDLPFLIKDGAVFVFTCGRRTSYSQFDASSDSLAENRFVTANSPHTPSSPVYGAI
jgi:hypothetical protein